MIVPRVHRQRSEFVFEFFLFACAALSTIGVTGAGIVALILIGLSNRTKRVTNITYYLLVCFVGFLSNNFSLVLSLILIFVLTFIGVYELNRIQISKHLIKDIKWIAAGAIGLIVFMTCINGNQFIQFMTRYWDHVSHFGILRNLSETSKVYDFVLSDLYSGWLHYPQGWHSSVFTLFGSMFFTNSVNAIATYMFAFTLTILFLFLMITKSFLRVRSIKSTVPTREFLILLYFSISLFSSLTFFYFIFQGAFVNFAFSISLIILAFNKIEDTKRVTLLLALSALSYTNFVLYFLIFSFLLLIGKVRSESAKRNRFWVLTVCLIVTTYLFYGVFTTKQAGGILTGAAISLDTAKYTVLASLVIVATVVLLRAKRLHITSDIFITVLASLFFLITSIIYAVILWEINYFLQKMLVASAFLLIVSCNKEVFVYCNFPSKTLVSNKHELVEKPQLKRELNIKLSSFLALTLVFATLLPPQLNSHLDFIYSINQDLPLDQVDIIRMSSNSNINDRYVFAFVDDKNDLYHSYLLNQWIAILGRHFTDEKQDIIEDCLRKVENLTNSSNAFEEYSNEIRMYLIKEVKCNK